VAYPHACNIHFDPDQLQLASVRPSASGTRWQVSNSPRVHISSPGRLTQRPSSLRLGAFFLASRNSNFQALLRHALQTCAGLPVKSRCRAQSHIQPPPTGAGVPTKQVQRWETARRRRSFGRCFQRCASARYTVPPLAPERYSGTGERTNTGQQRNKEVRNSSSQKAFRPLRQTLRISPLHSSTTYNRWEETKKCKKARRRGSFGHCFDVCAARYAVAPLAPGWCSGTGEPTTVARLEQAAVGVSMFTPT
jgi:hypothetical protein